jgi:hypothetical protein
MTEATNRKRAGGKQTPGQARDKAGDRWLPIADGTMDTVSKVRTEVQKRTRMRPDLSVVVAAMLEHASASPEVIDAVARHALEVYTKALSQREPEVTPEPEPAATT